LGQTTNNQADALAICQGLMSFDPRKVRELIVIRGSGIITNSLAALPL